MPTILVVDDEPTILDLLVQLLDDEGYATLAAPDGVAALELLAREAADLVLLDVMLPGLDGPGVVRRLREQPRTAAIPVVLMSAARQPGLDGLDHVAFLRKPFDLDQLLAIVARALGRASPDQ